MGTLSTRASLAALLMWGLGCREAPTKTPAAPAAVTAVTAVTAVPARPKRGDFVEYRLGAGPAALRLQVLDVAAGELVLQVSTTGTRALKGGVSVRVATGGRPLEPSVYDRGDDQAVVVRTVGGRSLGCHPFAADFGDAKASGCRHSRDPELQLGDGLVSFHGEAPFIPLSIALELIDVGNAEPPPSAPAAWSEDATWLVAEDDALVRYSHSTAGGFIARGREVFIPDVRGSLVAAGRRWTSTRPPEYQSRTPLMFFAHLLAGGELVAEVPASAKPGEKWDGIETLKFGVTVEDRTPKNRWLTFPAIVVAKPEAMVAPIEVRFGYLDRWNRGSSHEPDAVHRRVVSWK